MIERGAPGRMVLRHPMSNERVTIDYNDELKPLEMVLAGVQRAGDFVAHGRAGIARQWGDRGRPGHHHRVPG